MDLNSESECSIREDGTETENKKQTINGKFKEYFKIDNVNNQI